MTTVLRTTSYLLGVCTLVFVAGQQFAVTGHETESCAMTQPVMDEPQEDIFGGPPFYRGEDGAIWAGAGGIWYADGIKVGWRKPPGSTLEITGRRLDGEAPPLEASVPDGYGGAFQATGLIFPTAGCWEVQAQAADSELTFITYVYPKAYKQFGACHDLEQTANKSTFILVAGAEATDPAAHPGFFWQTVRVVDAWFGSPQEGNRLEVLIGPERGEILMEPGKTYLLFLWTEPGYHLQTYCPAVVEVDGDRVAINGDWTPLWEGDTLEAIREQIREVRQRE